LRLASEAQKVERLQDQLLFGSRRWPSVFEYRFNRVTAQPGNSVWVMRFFTRFVFWCVSAESGEGNDADHLFHESGQAVLPRPTVREEVAAPTATSTEPRSKSKDAAEEVP
jgi:hypothetical protein